MRMWRRILSSRERVTERPRLCAPVAAQWTQRCGRSRSAGTAFRGPSRWIPRRPRTWSAPAGAAAGTGHQAADPARRRPGSAGAVAWSSSPLSLLVPWLPCKAGPLPIALPSPVNRAGRAGRSSASPVLTRACRGGHSGIRTVSQSAP